MNSITKIVLLILCTIAILAAISNPGISDHQEAVRQNVMQLVRKEAYGNSQQQNYVRRGEETAGKELGLALGNMVAEKIVNYAIDRDNYVLFSFTTFNWNQENNVIGIGIFGKVFLLEDLDKKLNRLNGKGK